MPRLKEEIRAFTGGIVANKTSRDLVVTESPEIINMSSAKIGSLLTCNKPTDYYGSNTGPSSMSAVQANYGYYVFKSDYNVAVEPVAQTNGVNLELYVDTSDSGTSVQVYDGTNLFDCGAIGTGADGKLVFYDANGALRISDADFTNTANYTYWFGMIEHQFLSNGSSEDMSDLLNSDQKAFFADILDTTDDMFDFGGNNDDGATTLIDGDGFTASGGGAPTATFIKESTPDRGRLKNSTGAAGIVSMPFISVIGWNYNVSFDVIGADNSNVKISLSATTSYNSGADSGSKDTGTNYTLANDFIATGTTSYIVIENISTTINQYSYLDNIKILERASAYASAQGYADWVFLKNKLPAPTSSVGEFSGGADPTPPAYGVGYALQVSETTGETTGLWPAGTYEFACSHIYLGGQESKLGAISNTLTMGADEKSQKMNVQVFTTIPTSSGNTNWNRIIGGRIYWRNVAKKGSWKLFVDLDLKKDGGGRPSLTDDYTGFTSAAAPVWPSSSTYTIAGPNPMTYESLNGHRSGDIYALGFGEDDEFGFSTALIAKSRTWVANVRYKDEFGVIRTMGDRILYTPPGKYDTFPTNYWLDIGASDGEAFVKLEFLNGMLLAFKTNTLYVVNIAGASEVTWGVQSVHSHMGIGNPNATCHLKNAVVWANQDGVYMFAGGQVTEISLKAQPTIGSELTADGDKACVGYDVVNKEIIVRLDVNGATAWIYHVPTQSWYKTDEFGTKDQTNFSMIDDVLTWQEHDTDTNYLDTRKRTDKIVVHSDTANTTNSWTSKDFDFNAPGTPKKIYAIIFTYSVVTTSNVCKFDYATDGGALGNTVTLSTIASDASPQRHKFTTPIKCNSFQLKFYATASNSIELESITIEYRALTVAKSE